MTNQEIQNLIAQATSKGCRFVSFLYKAKGTGELARHVILLGASLENAYKKDLDTLKGLSLSGIAKVACGELIDSVTESLKKGIGNNSSYTQKGMHETLLKGLRQNKDNGILQVYGMQMSKSVIEKGVYKSVNSSEKTLAKKAIRKDLRAGKIRSYNIEAGHLQSAKIEGETLILA